MDDFAEKPTAEQRLRAFEDKHLGANVPRIKDQIERGIGSRHAMLDAVRKAEHAALERLVNAEKELVEATAAMDRAKAEHAAASEAVDGPKPVAALPAPETVEDEDGEHDE